MCFGTHIPTIENLVVFVISVVTANIDDVMGMVDCMLLDTT